MSKRICTLVSLALLAVFPMIAQPMSIGAALATVKLTKTEIITEQYFKQEVAKIAAARGTAVTDEEKRSFLDDKINEILFLQMCERDGLRVSDSEIDSYVAKAKAQLGPTATNEQFEQYLASQGGTVATLKTLYKNQLLMQRWLTTAKAKEIAALPPISVDDVLKLYELNKAKLVRPDTVRISFVVYQFKDKTEAERKKGSDIIRGLSERLSKGTDTFDAIRLKAQEGGYTPSKDTIYFEKGENFLKQFGKTMYDTVFSLKDNTISAPFENEVGWWIVRRIEFYPQKQLELSDPVALGQPGTVQEYIAQNIGQQRQTEFMTITFKELFDKLRKQAEIKITGKM